MESTKGFIFDRKTKLCLYVAWYVVSWMWKTVSHPKKTTVIGWWWLIDFDFWVRQHPMWPSYEELIDHLPHPWRNELNDRNYQTPWFCHGIRYYSLWKYEHVKMKRERSQKGIKLLTNDPCKIHDITWPHFPMVPCFSHLQVSFQVI
jgi:hypothetical protein